MKLATLAICSFISLQAMAQATLPKTEVKIVDLESLGGDLAVSLEVNASATKKGLILKKVMAKKEAVKAAKAAVSESLGKICRYGSFIEEDISFSEPSCSDAGETMDCGLKAQVRCSEISERNTIGLQIDNGLIEPSSACLKLLEGSFKIDNEIVNHCNRIRTKTQYECVSTLASYSSIKTLGIRACSVFTSELSQQVLEQYRERGFEAPTPNLIVVLAGANTDQEATCLKNKLMLNSLSIQDLETSCLKDSKVDLDKREKEALGFIVSPRSTQFKVKNVFGF